MAKRDGTVIITHSFSLLPVKVGSHTGKIEMEPGCGLIYSVSKGEIVNFV